ncbi:hypothetical protein [Rhodopseudomonas palustris]|uniref:hypothetical protein n=1 Tax=Rhodopseudomonas palustris TaxID=1076 RepID=UPI0014039CF3|nr:hypothetical protein [Rhodopseudomonas palustris]
MYSQHVIHSRRDRRTTVRSQKAWRSSLLLATLMAVSIAINAAIVLATGNGG